MKHFIFIILILLCQAIDIAMAASAFACWNAGRSWIDLAFGVLFLLIVPVAFLITFYTIKEK